MVEHEQQRGSLTLDKIVKVIPRNIVHRKCQPRFARRDRALDAARPQNRGGASMSDMPIRSNISEAEVVATMSKALLEKFGDRAVSVATSQLAAAHRAGDSIADRWLSILLSIEEQLGRPRRTAAPGSDGEP